MVEIVMVRGVSTSLGDRYPGDRVSLPAKEALPLIRQKRALEATDANVERVRADVERREAAGEIVRPPAA
jgi:hypothetical protein